MLSLPDEVNEVLTPDLSKSEIQQLKEDVDEEKRPQILRSCWKKRTVCSRHLTQTLEKAVYQLGKDAPEIYEKLWTSSLENGETGKHFIENLIPNEKAVYTVRIPGAGAHMLAITENSDEVKLLNCVMRAGTRYIAKRILKSIWEDQAMQQEHGENPGKRNMVKNYRKKSKLHRTTEICTKKREQSYLNDQKEG